MRNTFAFQSMISIALTGLTLALSLAPATFAQEHDELGRMWTFENPPLIYLQEEYDFTPSEEWLHSLRLGSLRLGTEDIQSNLGSASFVSPNGLILTSLRSVRDAIAATLDKDGPTRTGDPLKILKTGFVAETPQQELRLRANRNEHLTAAQLIKISNVTDEIIRGIAPTDTALQMKVKRDANKKMILEAAGQADPELAPQIVSLYQGAEYQLYQYKVYDDIRLVCIPHLQTAVFGGDHDNFTYPRYCVDFAFLRAYENGKPVDTTNNYFQWKPGGAEQDELIFVSGNPGTTRRLHTNAQLDLERDIRIPIEIERLANSLPIWKDPRSGTYVGTFDPENPSRYWAFERAIILRLENDLKAARGNLHGLEDTNLMALKTTAEQAFKRRVMADKNLAQKYGELWDQIADVTNQRRQHEARARFQTAGGSPMLDVAVAIVRLLDPAETDEHRKPARKTIDRWAGVTINSNFHMDAHVLDHFIRAQNWLPKDDPYFTKVLGGRSPAEFADLLMTRSPSWLGHPEQRDALIESGWKTIQDSDDPIVMAARELVPLMRENEKRSEELDAREQALGIELARALFECYGTNVSPDATKTPRFSDGIVSGYTFNGTIAPHHTTFDGLYARNAEFNNTFPFNLPAIWLERKDAIDMTKPVNFISTNDITSSGGSSGSVVVNKELEVVGVVIDGNDQSLHNDFVFTDDVPRAVSMHVDGIMEALVKIYEAHRLVEELMGE